MAWRARGITEGGLGPSSIRNVSPPRQKFREAAPPPPKENVFWHTLLQTPPPRNYTPGLIPVLKRTFTRLHAKGLTNRVVLCADGVCYVGTEWCKQQPYTLLTFYRRTYLYVPSSTVDFGWGCGWVSLILQRVFADDTKRFTFRYRNFLMACTSLITQQRQPMYFPLLDIANGSVSRPGRQSTGATEMTGPGVRGLQAWIEDAWRKGTNLHSP